MHMLFAPKPGAREHSADLIQSALSTRYLSPGQASRLRSTAQWLDTGLVGRCSRGALSALAARQYYELSDSIVPGNPLAWALEFLLMMTKELPSRPTPLSLEYKPTYVMYSDASWCPTSSRLRVGALLVPPVGPCWALVLDIPESVRLSFRSTQSIRGNCTLSPCVSSLSLNPSVAVI